MLLVGWLKMKEETTERWSSFWDCLDSEEVAIVHTWEVDGWQILKRERDLSVLYSTLLGFTKPRTQRLMSPKSALGLEITSLSEHLLIPGDVVPAF